MDSFHDALRRRLSLIDQSGQDQTTWQRLQSQREASKRLYEQRLAEGNAQLTSMRNQQSNASNMGAGFSYSGGGKVSTGNSTLDSFINSIATKESGNNYNARNKTSGAMGKYQIMPSNIIGNKRGWDYEVLGYDITPQQFMSSPQLQDQIAKAKLSQYYNKYGAAGAAIAWYAGPGAANKYKSSGYVSTSKQGAYPSINAYQQAILKGMGL